MHQRLYLVGVTGINQKLDIDPEAIRIDIQVGYGYDRFLLLSEHDVDRQCCGQRALGRSVPGWR
jgi:hypothetical protein